MTGEKVKSQSSTAISRRSVIKGAVALGAVAVSGGLALNLASPGSAEAALKKMPLNGTRLWMWS